MMLDKLEKRLEWLRKLQPYQLIQIIIRLIFLTDYCDEKTEATIKKLEDLYK